MQIHSVAKGVQTNIRRTNRRDHQRRVRVECELSVDNRTQFKYQAEHEQDVSVLRTLQLFPSRSKKKKDSVSYCIDIVVWLVYLSNK